MNDKLLQPFTQLEVEATFQQMGPLKSLGLYEFGASFYQKHWATVGMDVNNAVLSILNGKGIIPSLNSTFIFSFQKIRS